MKLEIELFRIIGIFGIVWFHSGVEAGREVAYGGLIFFIIISVYFATVSTRRHSYSERIQRLIVPCIIWSFFYGTIKFIQSGHVFPEEYGYFSRILSTPSIHLWFLPFIFLVIVAIDHLRNFLFKEWVGILLGVCAILAISFAPIWREFNYISPLNQYTQAMPAVLIGMFLGVFNKIKVVVRVLLLVGIVCSIFFVIFKGQSGIGIPYIVGLIPCVFIFYENFLIKNGKYVAVLSSSTFGVYLLHVFLLMVLRHVGMTGYSLPITAFVLSMLSILVFRKFTPKYISKYVV